MSLGGKAGKRRCPRRPGCRIKNKCCPIKPGYRIEEKRYPMRLGGKTGDGSKKSAARLAFVVKRKEDRGKALPDEA